MLPRGIYIRILTSSLTTKPSLRGGGIRYQLLPRRGSMFRPAGGRENTKYPFRALSDAQDPTGTQEMLSLTPAVCEIEPLPVP